MHNRNKQTTIKDTKKSQAMAKIILVQPCMKIILPDFFEKALGFFKKKPSGFKK